MLTLHRLPRAYRALYVGIAVLLTAAVGSHWVRLGLRHGAGPRAVVEWYRGAEAAMLFPKTGIEVAEDAWGNLLHHTLAFLVLGGLLVRTAAAPARKAWLAAGFGLGTLAAAAGPLLVWWGVPGAAAAYVGSLALLTTLAAVVAGLVTRDAVLRRGGGPRGVPGGDLWRVAGMAATLVALPGAAAGQAGVHFTEGEAIRDVFPAARWVATDTLRPDSAARAALEDELGRPLYEPVFIVRRLYAARPAYQPLGYALVTDERGKYRPITMLVGVDSAGRVTGVRILVYREPRGGEVARQFFLRQYRGKRAGDPIRLNRDIINVSGATISVVSVNAGVRKTLALVRRYFPQPIRPPGGVGLSPVESLP